MLGLWLAAAVALAGLQAEQPGLLVGNAVKFSASGSELDGSYPERAQRMGTNGHASLLCAMGDAAKLKTCKVLNEAPASWYFSDAARRVAALLRVDTAESMKAGDLVALTATFTGSKVAADLKRVSQEIKSPQGAGG